MEKWWLKSAPVSTASRRVWGFARWQRRGEAKSSAGGGIEVERTSLWLGVWGGWVGGWGG